MLSVCLPSRGLIHSRTIEELLIALNGYDYDLIFSHGKSIPRCFNYCVEQALATKNQWLLFIEEDMSIPPTVVDDMFHAKGDIVGIDYPVAEDHSTVNYTEGGQVLYCGMGILLVNREVFEKLGEPYFRTNVTYAVPEWREIIDKRIGYGRQDVDFGIRANKLGYEIKILPYPTGHYKVEKMGGKDNEGYHEVTKWEKINRFPPKQKYQL